MLKKSFFIITLVAALAAAGVGVLGQRRGPRGVVGGGDELGLEPVDPGDHRAEQRARIPP